MPKRKDNIMNSVKNLIEYNINSLNNNKLFIGLAMIFLNIASKYFVLEISDTEESLIKNLVTREIFIFVLIFTNTRDIILSVILTAGFVILSNTIFNTKSKFCLIPEKYKKLNKVLDLNKDGKVSDKEIEHAKQILKKANINSQF